MAGTFKLEIITPDKTFPVMNLTFIDVPAEHGRLTVLADHESMICGLKAGPVFFRDIDGSQTEWKIGPGTMNVDHNNITVLVRDVTPEQQ